MALLLKQKTPLRLGKTRQRGKMKKWIQKNKSKGKTEVSAVIWYGKDKKRNGI
jgi:hypothetical protein